MASFGLGTLDQGPDGNARWAAALICMDENV
jgi:hypothetical protein